MTSTLRQPRRLTFAVFLTGLCLAAVAALVVRHRLEDDAHVRFLRNVDRLLVEIGQRLSQPVHELEAAAAWYAEFDGKAPPGFVDHIRARGLARHDPGVIGYGFVQRERSAAAAAGPARGDSDRYVVRGFEPSAREARQIGIDHGQDPRARNAIEWAIATGRPAITARLDPPATAGLARLNLYVPVYRAAGPTATPAQRDAALLGLLYAPIDTEALLQGVFEVAMGRLRFELFDRVGPVDADSRLHASDARAPGTGEPVGSRSEPAAGPGRHTTTQTLSLLGRTLTVRAESTAAFDGEVRLSWPWWVFALGALTSALMAGLVWQLAAGRQRAEALARGMTAELAQLALVARETSNAVVITDRSRRITWVNAGFERVSGYTASEAVGRSPGRLLQFAGTDPQVVARMRAALDAGEPFCGDVLNRHKLGHPYWLRLHIQPLHDEAGALSGFMAVETDITELVDATRAAERANRAKSEFIAMISHELRTPLQSVVGFSELGEHFAQGQPTFVQMFGDILAGGRRMLALVNGLLDVAKIEGGEDAPVLRSSDLGELAAEVAHELRPLAVGRRLRIEFVPDRPRLPVRVDDVRVQQALRNVLANAIRFAPEGSTIEVSGARRDGHAVLEVRDHGSGIPDAELESIFEPFVQSSRTRGGAGGSGLGLTISRKILRAHGGWIEAANATGGGACLRMTLPTDPAATAADLSAAPAANEAASTAATTHHDQGIPA